MDDLSNVWCHLLLLLIQVLFRVAKLHFLSVRGRLAARRIGMRNIGVLISRVISSRINLKQILSCSGRSHICRTCGMGHLSAVSSTLRAVIVQILRLD